MNFILLNNHTILKQKLQEKILISDVNSILYLIIGSILVLLYIMQLMLSVKFEALYELQSNIIYKQVTGYLLIIYILYQFKLAKERKNTKLIRYHFSLHKIQGIFAPLVLYIHSMEMGYAYQVLLSCLFLTNCVIGLLSPQQLKIKNAGYVSSWLIIHVSIAMLIVGLVGYHLFITYWYS